MQVFRLSIAHTKIRQIPHVIFFNKNVVFYQSLDHSSHCKKMQFSVTDFFSKCDQICRKRRIWSHLLKKSVIENSIFCAASVS